MAILLAVASALTAQLPVKGGDFPHITREWVDSTGEYRVTAKLVSATPTTVELRKEEEGQTIQVPVRRLDERSREIAKLAAPIFLVESKMRHIVQTMKQAGDDVDRRALHNQLIAEANQELKKVKISTRYLIVSVSDLEEGKTTGSKAGEYSVKFINMYSFHLNPDKPGASGRHTSGWTFKAEEFALGKVVTGRSYVEIVGTPLIGPYSRDFTYGNLGRNTSVGMSPRPMEIRVVTPGLGEGVY